MTMKLFESYITEYGKYPERSKKNEFHDYIERDTAIAWFTWQKAWDQAFFFDDDGRKKSNADTHSEIIKRIAAMFIWSKQLGMSASDLCAVVDHVFGSDVRLEAHKKAVQMVRDQPDAGKVVH